MANQRPIRFGILGAAKIAPKALTIPAKLVPEVEITAIAARDPERAREFAKTNNIPRVLATYQDLIADPEVDVVYIPLPNSLHCEWSIRSLREGKHVLCEKPIASNAVEAALMARVAKETGLLLGEAFHYCYHPLADRVRELVRDGALGELKHVEGHFSVPIPPTNIRFDWNLSGGATMDLGCYPLHMIRYFSGMTPSVIVAQALIGPPNIDIAMEAELKLTPGVTARMTCSMAADAQRSERFLARGDSGELQLSFPTGSNLEHELKVCIRAETIHERVPGDETFVHQLQAFVAALRGDVKAFPTDGKDAVIGIHIIDEVYQAAGLPPRGRASSSR